MTKKCSISKSDLYNFRKSYIYLSPNYEFTKKNIQHLYKPLCNVKETQSMIQDLTYKKVNDWDNKELISSSREKEKSGWRKFSIIDILKLYIISDLKKFGFSTDKIKIILSKISSGSMPLLNLKGSNIENFEIKNPEVKYENFLALEYFTFSCFNGIKIILLIDELNEVFFFTEEDFVKLHFVTDEVSTAILILPFFSYVQNISHAMKNVIKIKNNELISKLSQNNPTEKENKILESIRQKNYREILITKSNNEEIKISAKSSKSGDFSEQEVVEMIKAGDFQKVTTIKKDGKIVSLIQEESIKF